MFFKNRNFKFMFVYVFLFVTTFLVGGFFVFNTAFATTQIDKKINLVSVNGSTSVTVLPNSSIDISIEATNGNLQDFWESTGYQIGTEQIVCKDTTNVLKNETTESKTFSILAPLNEGNYDLKVWIYTGGCNSKNKEVGPVTLVNGIIVKEAVTLNDEADIISFDSTDPVFTGAITTCGENNEGNCIALTVPYGTDTSKLPIVIEVSDKATINIPSGVTDLSGTTIYTVTAEDGITTKNYSITVKIEEKPTEEILKTTPTILWENPETITYGDLLSEIQLNATNTEGILGTYTYSPEIGEKLNVGDNQTLSVLFTPDDLTLYNTATKTVVINVEKVVTVIPESDDNDSVTASKENPEVVVSSNIPLTITIEGNTEAKIDVSKFTGEIGEGIIPEIKIISATASVEIPAGNVKSSDPAWNGVISAPTVTTVTLPKTLGQTKTLGTAIELGFTGAKLTFEKAVKITMPDQAGKKVGYTRGIEPFTEITNTCVSLDDQDLINAYLVDGKEDCKIDNGLNLVIWTKHFTKFATYTETKNNKSIVVGGYIAPVTIPSNKIITDNEKINNNTEIIENKIALNKENTVLNKEKTESKVPAPKVEEQTSVNSDLLISPKNVIESNLLVSSAGNIMGIPSVWFSVAVILLLLFVSFIIIYHRRKNKETQ